jgi:hypothetical protein
MPQAKLGEILCKGTKRKNVELYLLVHGSCSAISSSPRHHLQVAAQLETVAILSAINWPFYPQ